MVIGSDRIYLREEVLMFVCQVGNNETKRSDAKRAYLNFFLYGVPMFIFVCDSFEFWRRYIRPRRCASKSTSRCLYMFIVCVTPNNRVVSIR